MSNNIMVSHPYNIRQSTHVKVMVIVVLDNSKHMAYLPLSENHGDKPEKKSES